ncbi:hypothetical protein [Janibacter melonis]|uniref:hypothetical protein n=1 Tax=Janibacter melonis TaxID=262209 RepID=UPI0019196F6A|nr:hypothetical protein [Janibacter melonis]
MTPRHVSLLMRSGLTFIAFGALTFVGSLVVDSGFVHGAFQGATVALMVGGAYLLGRRLWSSDADPDEDGMWLPSRDGADEG